MHPYTRTRLAELTWDVEAFRRRVGVWSHLPPLLRNASGWDVLVAHYLGLDHAGHTHGVRSAQTADKLAQMNAQMRQVRRGLASCTA